MKTIDVHAHLCDENFDSDRAEVLSRIEKEMSACVCASYDLNSSKQAIELAKKHPKIYASVGVHPENVADFSAFMVEIQKFLKEKNFLENNKIVAIGEIGLDYHYFSELSSEQIEKEKLQQKEIFAQQIRLANQLSLPIEVHCRDAMQDCLTLLKEICPNKPSLMHCFSGTVEDAQELMSLGFSFSVGGIVTFKNAKKLQEVVKFLPLERIMLETDCPYLSPEPFRGKRNEPINVKYVADKIAQIKEVPFEKVIEKTTQNAIEMFGLKI